MTSADSHRINFAGAAFDLVDEAALFWPEQQALLVADLHLEKGSAFAATGQFLPPYDSIATLERLADIAKRCDARAIYCLGDNFHDDGGPARLESSAQRALDVLTARHRWHWIVGNHDAALADNIGGRVHDELSVGGITLRHEAVPGFTGPEISGHFHPKLRMMLGGKLVTRRAVVQLRQRLVLPAFGAYTGGMDISEIARIVDVRADPVALVHTKKRCVSIAVENMVA